MQWLEVSLEGVDGEGVEAVWEHFQHYTHGSPVIEEIRETAHGPLPEPRLAVRGYIPDTPNGLEAVQKLREAIWHLSMIYPLPEVQVRPLHEKDWTEAWKQHYHRQRVGERLVIAPAWDTTPPAEDEIVIFIDPGMAFGTGQHPSTQLVLRLLEAECQPGMRVYDVGCGSGILSIAAAKLGASQIDAVDIDAVAVEATCENAERNNVPCGPDTREGIRVATGSIETFAGPYDLILINILAEIIVGLLPHVPARLAPGGRAILAGIIAEREPLVLDALRLHGLHVVRRETMGDWVGLVIAANEDK
ncbi:ribosomal protein L11 methyltransferase [Ardenticatena maritima]|uniref:Ribosomal protein L11 methyltransferase n=1 Tax=Ardenticatena maritima TaxID=872965 RepID=A0A0M8K7U0_9CHLR|nr:50S ribosomal protein L11 methyltransferase [Ardenticatena maritima]KPL86282.1 hypothetical protein SE16_13110 [Ardenticatena maritima]GAP62086.1 ribosomal protein L11 methyltransferase [Ardenticatena maritima]